MVTGGPQEFGDGRGDPYSRPGPPPYGAGYPVPPAPPGGAGLAIASLVLGILALVLCWTVLLGVLLGLPAVILGIVHVSRAGRRGGHGRGMAIAGTVTGALGMLAAILFVVVGVSLLNSNSGKTLQHCLQQAGDDQAAQARCQQQFQHSITGG